ncbi:ZYRO0F10692p [Zygosaccharomyces rouxii]|uniref:Transcription initiation factor IIA large subunit n=1 Tax=Zygosaccharomyces rouxii (strain ATCC 2623 / CBS 732 / NBRC 1130 / NCYC 568 / NRRL Y-229) TaxID=559307 RepID=C5DY68_ZYGRC|nr:uncharacterized protein ZYRO0F10692g [Zygosaccharomyces rouxii]KAH9199487.1 transcription factor IIA, alpha/beta subunit-domain-containing protein [Zygosaccharomyces rouxii]CAR28729.1 ZYRO0F10692p [Zygosaccharomyces rouxii]
MSNPEASRVYELIVDSVVNEVREDFENAGIDEQTLQDLKRVWQIKLSETQVTKFSWDPQEAEYPGQQLGSQVEQDDNSLRNGIPSEYTLNSDSQGLVLPGFPNEGGSKVDQLNAAPESELQEQQDDDKPADDDNDDPKGKEIELSLSYPDGNAPDMTKMQEKKAKRSALLDTDEVGSELDDSDDDYLISEGEEDGPDENLMLCLYDKVTRTKARWKCSLKDGIVTVNRKDYTFQKSQVEAEWV